MYWCSPIKILIVLYLIILISSCSKADNTKIVIEEGGNLHVINIGEFIILDESISMIPYLNKNRVTFIDSFNSSVEFFIEEDSLYQTDSSYIVRYDVFEEGDTVTYHYSGEFKTFRIYNDSLNITFKHTLRAKPYIRDPEPGYLADVLTIWFKDPEIDSRFHSVFKHVVNQRTWPMIIEPEFFSKKEFLEREYTLVYYFNYLNPIIEVYYNYEFGIVAFTDVDGKLWRFDHFE